MKGFKNEIDCLNDIETLQEKKRRIKDLVINPDLNWSSRAELYRQVQLINIRIEQLTDRATTAW